MTQPLGAVAPTTLHRLRECGLRVAYDRAGDGGPRPSSPGARLGNAAHAVLAMVARGKCGDADEPGFDEAVSTAWERAIAEQAAESARHPVEAAFGAPPAWPSFNDVASRLAHEARMLSAEARGWGSRKIVIEEPIHPHDSVVWGTPDLIVGAGEGDGGDGLVVDFKTSAVVEGDTEEGGRMRSQVLIYAYLARRAGIEVGRCEIRPIGRRPVPVPLDPDQIAGLLAEASELMARFNTAVGSGGELSLGRPSDDACAWCPHAARCEALWASPAAAAEIGRVGGVVASVEDNGRGVAPSRAVEPLPCGGPIWPASLFGSAGRSIVSSHARTEGRGGGANPRPVRWRRRALPGA
ncbi:MAG: PD-(D/E)XK nuclease family protein [Actinobacteria bacterium]|nr:PD-(D/E)XK nuclease family protein [Actinomycetota bacterium]